MSLKHQRRDHDHYGQVQRRRGPAPAVVSLEKAPDGLDVENEGQYADRHAYRRADQRQGTEAQEAPHQRQPGQDDVAE